MTLSDMPYTVFDLDQALKLVTPYVTRLTLIQRVRYAETAGMASGLSPHSPSMRVITQAARDYGQHGDFRFSK